jgi:hypothetical protein
VNHWNASLNLSRNSFVVIALWRDPFLPVILTGAVTRSVAGEMEGLLFPLPESLDRTPLLLLQFGKRFFGESPVALFSNWKFFQRADNIERVRALSRGKNILK